MPALGSSGPCIVTALSGNNVPQLGRDFAHNNSETFVRVALCLCKDANLFYVLHMQMKRLYSLHVFMRGNFIVLGLYLPN